MAISYKVNAKVVNIKQDKPKANDVFLVDTNVWYWMTYPNASSFISSQSSEYPSYLNRAMSANSTLHFSGLSLAELSHLIEKTEREIYEESVAAAIKSKEYRHNMPAERDRVVAEFQTAWKQVISLAEQLPVTIDALSTKAAFRCFQNEKIDGYDLFILESMKKNKVTQVITDDGDFATVSGIQVFTSNRNVINAAKNQGKYLNR